MLPEFVKIGIFKYAIEETRDPIILGSSLCYGRIDYEDLTIYIDDNMPMAKKEQTLWHEIMHGIINEHRIKLEEDDEIVVDALATGILQVLKDNPKLMDIYD